MPSSHEKHGSHSLTMFFGSIVLIIMGLLIAGVTGGASLIKSAQLRAVVTENTSFRTAYNTYYAQFGKVPGSDADLNTIDDAGDPWQNLFDEGIIDKKPETETGSAGGNTVKYVNSKFGKNAKWFLKNAGDSFVVSDFSNINVLILSGKSDFSTGALTNREAESPVGFAVVGGGIAALAAAGFAAFRKRE